jgi:hypothetical protein
LHEAVRDRGLDVILRDNSNPVPALAHRDSFPCVKCLRAHGKERRPGAPSNERMSRSASRNAAHPIIAIRHEG